MPKICYQQKSFRKESLLRIEKANEIIDQYAAQGFDLTLRQLYYQFVARDLIPNTEKSYDSLGALISDARLAGLIDWDRIQDRTRHLRTNSHWDSPGHIVRACASQYRIDRWAMQPYRPEVFIEKDALVGVIEGVCTELDIPYFSCRGYTSQSEMWRAGRRMKAHIRNNQTPLVIHFGDHDPSGIDMTRDVQERLSLFAGAEIEVRRVALNMDQIRLYNPPPNPAKVTDSRFEAYRVRFGDESWELDALEPTTIVDLVRTSVEAVMVADEWQRSIDREQTEAGQLQLVSTNWDTIVGELDNGESE